MKNDTRGFIPNLWLVGKWFALGLLLCSQWESRPE